MKNYFKTDSPRVKMYMTENAEWQKTLRKQKKEIPLLERMLTDAIVHMDTLEEAELGIDVHFREQLLRQQEEIDQLNNALNIQQKRLAKDSVTNLTYDTEALCTQDILRDKIKDVEKNHVELKCNFMKYLSNVL